MIQSSCGVMQDSISMPNDDCDRHSFTERIEQVPARRRTTTQLRTAIAREIGENARSVHGTTPAEVDRDQFWRMFRAQIDRVDRAY